MATNNTNNPPNFLSASGRVDPILSLNQNNVKNDILLFKNETLKDFKYAQKKMSEKYTTLNMQVFQKLDSYEKRIEAYELKINELSKLINTDKIIREKVDKLIEFKEKADESMLTEKIRLDNFRNDLNSNINRIDNILKDSVIYPDIIGGISKYKTFHDLIDYVLTQCSLNLTFREKSNIDLKSYKEKFDNMLSSFNTQINYLLNTTSEFTKTAVKECEGRMQSVFNLYDDRLQDTRIENANYAVGIERATDALKKELQNLYVIKNELYEKVDNGIAEIKKDNNRVIKLFIGYKKGFNLLQTKFTQLSEFIKDVRFRINLKEDVKSKEFVRMSNMINFNKRKKGFMDGVIVDDKSFLRKGLESQLKDYISGKIIADELFKKKETKSIKTTSNRNNMKHVGAYKRNNLSMVIKMNEASKLNVIDSLRFNKSLPKKCISTKFEMNKNGWNDTNKKEALKEEDEDNYSINFEKSELKEKGKNDIDIKDFNEDVKIDDTSAKKENNIQIISKDKKNKENKDSNENLDINNNEKLKTKTSLKNVISDIFNTKNIIYNMKNIANEEVINNKMNKSEKKIDINSNNKNINANNTYNSNNIEQEKSNVTNYNSRIISNYAENKSFQSDKKNVTNKNKPSTMINFRAKNMNEKNSNINNQIINSPIKKKDLNQNIKINNNNNRNNIKMIAGQIRKQFLNSNQNNSNSNSIANKNSLNDLNLQKMDKNNKKTNSVSGAYSNKENKSEKSIENFILNGFIPRNDINVDEKQYLILKKKNNIK